MAFPLAAVAGAIRSFGNAGAGSVFGSVGSAASMAGGDTKANKTLQAEMQRTAAESKKVTEEMEKQPGLYQQIAQAAIAVTAKFNEVVSISAQFVQGFDPAIVAQMNRAFAALDATIGQALRPVIVSAIDIVMGFGSAINQAMRQFAPVIEKVTDSISQALQPAFDALGAILEGLMPVFDTLADIVGGVIKVLGDMARIIRPAIELIIEIGKQMFGALFGDDVKGQVKGFMEQVRDAIQSLVRNLILVVAAFLKMIGATKTLDALMKGLQPKKQEDIRGNLAPQNVQMIGIGDMAKQIAQAAFAATGKGGKEDKKPEDFLAGILDQVSAIKNGELSGLPKTAQEILEAMIETKKAMEALYQWFTKEIVKPVNDAFDAHEENAQINAKGAASRAAGRTPNWQGDKNERPATTNERRINESNANAYSGGT